MISSLISHAGISSRNCKEILHAIPDFGWLEIDLR